jgi:hypothetical protein
MLPAGFGQRQPTVEAKTLTMMSPLGSVVAQSLRV